MGCCPGVPLVSVPELYPEPPPVCGDLNFIWSVRSVIKAATAVDSWFPAGKDTTGESELEVVNAEAWNEFDNGEYSLQSTFMPEFGVGGSITTNASKTRVLSVGAHYIHQRRIAVIPLSVDGTTYSLRELYGIDALKFRLRNHRQQSGPNIPGWVNLTTGVDGYTDLFTEFKFYWNLVGSDVIEIDTLGGSRNHYVPKEEHYASDGMEGLVSDATLIDTVTLNWGPPYQMGPYGYYDDEIDITSLVDEEGELYLILLVEPVVTPAKQSFSISRSDADKISSITVALEGFGPTHARGSSSGPGLSYGSTNLVLEGRDVLFYWGCINSIVLRIDIDQDSSDLEEEEYVDTASYDTGTGLTKEFLAENDGDLPGATPTTEIKTTPGSGTFTVPDGVGSLIVECWGGGGGGSRNGPGGDGGGGGGGGAYVKRILTVQPGFIYNYYVGDGGAGGNDSGDDGEDTWFINGFQMKAGGGSGGDSRDGGAGGVGTGISLDVDYTGGTGGDSDTGGGGGGSSAGDAVNGNNGSNGSGATGGSGGAAPTEGGAGADGGDEPDNGDNAIEVGGGGGGGGGDASVGGDGYKGKIEITYTPAIPIARRCRVKLTEDSGDYYLNFELLRQVTPNDSDYYIDPDPAFGNQSHATSIQVGPSTSYASLEDIEGTEFTFTHDGADNATPANGTEDGSIKITVESINGGGGLYPW